MPPCVKGGTVTFVTVAHNTRTMIPLNDPTAVCYFGVILEAAVGNALDLAGLCLCVWPIF